MGCWKQSARSAVRSWLMSSQTKSKSYGHGQLACPPECGHPDTWILRSRGRGRCATPVEVSGGVPSRRGRAGEVLARAHRRRDRPGARSEHETLRQWVKAADKQQVQQAAGLGAAELEELKRLRKENAELRVEKEILRKAAQYFAKEMGR